MSTCVSLFDYTGTILLPWWEAGYRCVLIDLQHEKPYRVGDSWYALPYDIKEEFQNIRHFLRENDVSFCCGFPPCTDLDINGARWWREKEEKDLFFQEKAFELVLIAETLLQESGAPYFFENPQGRAATLRKPDFSFHPYEYAGWLDYPNDEWHYKHTNIWTGNGFVIPEKAPLLDPPRAEGQPDPWYNSVGGKSEKTKNFRSRTPLGFSIATFHANRGRNWQGD